jgi:cystathionine beta-synthase
MFCDTILDTIGNTPIVKLNLWEHEIEANVGLKLESFNPGLSIKDRMAVYAVRKAFHSGKLQPGYTIVEASSGNTGFGVAMVAAVYGCQCVVTMPDKASAEKIGALKALGAEVIICPSNVRYDDPASYYERAAAVADSRPNAVYINQYFNLDNSEAHYGSTGPEIWRQTGGKITHFISAAGTGGTISGTGRYLKEMNPAIRIIGVDAYGSALAKYHATGRLDEKEIYPYFTEGLGKNMIPANIDCDVIDQFVKVSDRDGALTARMLARKSGILIGHSSGAALFALYKIRHQLIPSDVVVVMTHDHGSKYLRKIYDDEWMMSKSLASRKELERNDQAAVQQPHLVHSH